LIGELEHLKIETRLIDEKFGECEEKTARWHLNWPRSVAEAELLKLQKSGQLPDDNMVVYYETMKRKLKSLKLITRVAVSPRCTHHVRTFF
jgi:hypothetical protein